MLYTLDIKQGEVREITGEGRFLNILSSSAGRVTVKASFKGSNVLSSDMLAGDAVEFDRKTDRLYISAPGADSIAVIWYGDIRLKNNGVSVKSPGLVKATVKFINGLTKLNSVTAQNQSITIKPSSEVLLTGADQNTSDGYPITTEKQLNVAGDVYAYSTPLDLRLLDGEAQTFIANKSLLHSGYTISRITGEDINLYMFHTVNPGGAFAGAYRVVNGVPTSLAGQKLAFGKGTSLSLDPRSCIPAYRNGRFYLAGIMNDKLGVMSSADLISWQVEKAAIEPPLWGFVGSADLVGAVDFSGRYFGFTQKTASNGSGFVIIDMLTGSVKNVDVDPSNAYVNHCAAGNARFYMGSVGGEKYAVIDLDKVTKGTSGVAGSTSRAGRLHDFYGDALQISRNGYSIIKPDGTAVYKEIANAHFNTIEGAAISSTSIIEVIGPNMRRTDLQSGVIQTVARTGENAAESSIIHAKLMRDSDDLHYLEMALFDSTVGGLYRQKLQTVSGKLEAVRCNILEVF